MRAAAAVLIFAALAGPAAAQANFDDINQAFGDQRVEQQRREAAAMQELLNDPTIQQAYQSHVDRGGEMSLPQYAYWHARTCGFDAGCAAQSAAVEAGIVNQTRRGYAAHLNGGGQPPADGARPGDEVGGLMLGVHIERDPGSPTGCSWVNHTTAGATYVGPADCPR